MFSISNLFKKYRDYRKVQSLVPGRIKSLDWRNGFSKDSIAICGITKENHKNFLSDKDYVLGHPYNGPYTSIIDNKLYLPMLLHAYKDYIPKYYIFISDGKLLPLEDSELYAGSCARVSLSSFFDLLLKKNKLVLKHPHSSIGQGFMLVEYASNRYLLNKEEITKDELTHKLYTLNQYIVTEYVYQHSYSSAICDSSVNTIRLQCVWDEEMNSFFIPRAFHRFGCNGSVVDNVGAGNGITISRSMARSSLSKTRASVMSIPRLARS